MNHVWIGSNHNLPFAICIDNRLPSTVTKNRISFMTFMQWKKIFQVVRA